MQINNSVIKISYDWLGKLMSRNIQEISDELTCVWTGTLTSCTVGVYAAPATSAAGRCISTALPFCKVNIISVGTTDESIITGAGLPGNAAAVGSLTATGGACGK